MFALVDCNNFYASCEEVFNPKLSRFPLIILSNNDGCVIARSSKAKKLGIKMGEPAFKYRDPVDRGEIQMLSSNFTLYADMSRRVMQTLESFSPCMETYSIDEAFFELEDSPEEKMCKESLEMRQKVKKWTGIPVSIGIGPTKTIAKLANEIAKKQISLDGVCALLSPENIRSCLLKTEPEEIWGIGPAYSQRLKTKRIYTAAQLIDCDDRWIHKQLGVNGYRTVLELRGIPCLTCDDEVEKKKSIVCSRSFKTPITDCTELEQAVATFASCAAEKLRRQQSRAKFISVFIATSSFIHPYEGRSCHINLPAPTSFTPEFIRLAKEGLGRIYRPNIEYKKAGVLLSNFCDESQEQIDWITPSTDSPKKKCLMKTIDAINRRYDKNAVRFAAAGLDEPLNGSRSRVSPKFTTSWNELLVVRGN